MAKFERQCVVCGKTYVFCPNRNDGTPRWHLVYCGDNCRDIWNYITTVYDRDGAKAAAEGLNELDLSYFGDIRKDAQEKIIRIFDEAGYELPIDLSNDEDNSDLFANSLEDEEDYSFFDTSIEFADDSDSVAPSVDE